MPNTKRRLTPEDIITFPYVSDAQISPDGQLIAYTSGDLVRDPKTGSRRHIWLVNTNGKDNREFSTGARADIHPRWSPDGKQLAFLSNRVDENQLQIYLMSRAGGEAVQLTTVSSAVDISRYKDTIQWSPDGKSIAFLLKDGEMPAEKKKKETQDDAHEFEKNHKFTRIWILDLATRALRQVTRGNVHVWEFAWSPDGKDFALVVSDSPYEWGWHLARLARVSAAGGVPKTLFNPAPRQLGAPRWSPDKKHIAFISMVSSDRGSIGGDIFLIAANGGKPRDVSPDYQGSVGWMDWKKNGRGFWVAGYEQGEAAFAELDLARERMHTFWREPVALAESGWARFTLSRDQKQITGVRSAPHDARNVWAGKVADRRVAWKRLTDSVPQLREYSLGEQEMISWTARDGMPMQGILIKPVGYKKGRRVPLIVCPHGGPTSLVSNGALMLGFWGQLLAQRGYAVFLPNYRGSMGFGLAFTEANVGDMGGMDFQDIEAGVDVLIERGIADPNHLGFGGWSYGGFMTCWTISQTTRYKGAVMGAGIANWLSFHGNSHLHAWDAIHYNANPYEAEGVYRKYSAMHYISQVKTPTLILHGELDRDVPAEQGYQFYRALHDHHIPTEFVIYPREGHGPEEKNHWLDIHRRIAEWYDKYVK